MKKNIIFTYQNKHGRQALTEIVSYCKAEKSHRTSFVYCSYENFTVDSYTLQNIISTHVGLINFITGQESYQHIFDLMRQVERWDIPIRDLENGQRLVCYFLKDLFLRPDLFIIDYKLMNGLDDHQKSLVQDILLHNPLLTKATMILIGCQPGQWGFQFPRFPQSLQEAA